MWRKTADGWVKTTTVASSGCPPHGRDMSPAPPAPDEQKGRTAALATERDSNITNITTTCMHVQETSDARSSHRLSAVGSDELVAEPS
eukprot:7371553-Heterocapsa_arctica.AAC.1